MFEIGISVHVTRDVWQHKLSCCVHNIWEMIDWLVITYIVLFSALLSRLIALACGSTWLMSDKLFITRFWISTEVVCLQRWHESDSTFFSQECEEKQKMTSPSRMHVSTTRPQCKRQEFWIPSQDSHLCDTSDRLNAVPHASGNFTTSEHNRCIS